jgi:hypothetical protein
MKLTIDRDGAPKYIVVMFSVVAYTAAGIAWIGDSPNYIWWAVGFAVAGVLLMLVALFGSTQARYLVTRLLLFGLFP